MTGRRPSATAAPEGALEILTLDALHRYVAMGLIEPGGAVFNEILDRLNRDADDK
jgi:hypothetical protein